MSTVTINKAFLKYYDEHGFGKKSAEEVRIAKLAFVAGYEAAEQRLQSDGAYRLPDSIQEALNSGDGTYRP